MSTEKLSLAQVESLATEALIGAGTRPESAKSVGKAALAAERDGIRSHGLLYVPIYCEHVKCGKVDGAAVPEVSQPRLSAIQVDAKTGFAHPAIDAGFNELIPLVKANGCVGLTISNSYNCGVLGYHVERLAEAGLVGIGFTNSPASIAPVGGKKPVLGTNPFALAVPDSTGGAAFVLDQSASVVAKSEIMMRAREGISIPEGWALDAEGQSTTDPEIALKGSMAPSGGYKGFGTGLLVEVMAAALSGAVLGLQASPFSGTAGGPPRTGQCFIAFDPEAFSGAEFYERISTLVEAVQSQDGARLPGDRRRKNRQRIELEGVEVAQSLLEKIRSYCA
ncbi:Ldh family oxidoreductase [bacterium]|jgi:(2R)-3-sulfolactate dehydrogenase (NADP+)|nr:Ldh family oxidoreductase [Deltaproteobacteria bacterium]MDB3917020.1 Ldh family oxidoreductase [bacterium]